jgi:transposase
MPIMSTSAKDSRIESLRKEGTLHPHPEDVRDELFQESEFFDPHDLLQVKYEMLRRVEKDKSPITDATAAFGFSRPSFYLAQTAFQRGGLGGLVPLKRGPKGAHKLTNEVMDFVVALLKEEPSLKTADLVSRIQERYGLTVHRRTIERALLRSQKKRQTEG